MQGDFSNTPIGGRRINNPDQDSIAYIALHGIPHTQIQKVKDFFAPYTVERNKRNRAMTQNINRIFKPFGIELDFLGDIVPISQYRDGEVSPKGIYFRPISKTGPGLWKGAGIGGFPNSEDGYRDKTLHTKNTF